MFSTFKRWLVLLSLLLLILFAAPAIAQDSSPTATPTISGTAAAATPTATPAGVRLEQYGLLELTVPISGQYADPGDPAQVDVTARFTAPNGRTLSVPGFWMQPQQQTCDQDCRIEIIRPSGQALWRVRFSPPLPGNWEYAVDLRDANAVRTVMQGRFSVEPSKRPGPIRVGPNRRYFQYENGTSYFPVGVNLGWSWAGARNTPGYQEWLAQLAQAGANYARLYVDVPWFIGLGWHSPAGNIMAAQEDAWRLDTVIRTAEYYGISLQIVLLWHQSWSTYSGLPVNLPSSPARPSTDADWFTNPFNVQRGGPLATAAEFFATPQGKQFFKNRLRYIVARWGYSTSIFAWELIDQIDRVVPNNPDVVTSWAREMVTYLRQIDPYRHPITIGARENARLTLVDGAALDFRQVRYFGRRPIAPARDQVFGALELLTPELAADRTPRIPLLVSEFSINPWFEPVADDPSGVHVISTMWAAALSGTAGGAMPTWWDTYLFPQNLTPMLGPLAAFTRFLPWAESNLRPVSVPLEAGGPISYGPLTVTGFNETFGQASPLDVTYNITPDGVFPPISSASAYLYGVRFNAQLGRPMQFTVAPPVDTQLRINVARVSDRASARLVVNIDGVIVAELTLGPRSPAASLSVPIRAGERRVVIDNLGDDYLQLASIEVAEYVTPLRVLAMADRQLGLFLAWAQHRDYTWQNADREPEPISVGLRAPGMPAGLYRVELWDPFTGNVVGQEDVIVSGVTDGPLVIDLLPISRMLAVRAVRIAEPGDLATATPTPTATPRVLPTVTPTGTTAP